MPSAGPWLATPGRFFPGWGRHVTEAELAEAAVQEAAAAAQEAAAAACRPHGGQPRTRGRRSPSARHSACGPPSANGPQPPQGRAPLP